MERYSMKEVMKTKFGESEKNIKTSRATKRATEKSSKSKGGKYEVIGTGRHSETLEEMVFYKHDSIEYGKDSLWARPLSMWSEHIEREGYSGPRFTLIEEDNK